MAIQTQRFDTIQHDKYLDVTLCDISPIIEVKTSDVGQNGRASFTFQIIQGGLNMTGTNCDLFTHKSSRSYLNHLVVQPRRGLIHVLCFFVQAETGRSATITYS